jgi:hypothetical protein
VRARIVWVLLLGASCSDSLTGLHDAGPKPPERHVWGDVVVNVGETPSAITGLTLIVGDRAAPPALDTTLPFAAGTTAPYFMDGARVHATQTCRAPGLVDIHVSTCAGATLISVSPADTPGCAVVRFQSDGRVGGNFIHPGGVTCEIEGGRGDLSLADPGQPSPRDGGPPTQVAYGIFSVDCLGADGSKLVLSGSFALPLVWRLLLC